MADPHGPPTETLLKAYELHLAGLTVRQVGAELGVSLSTASGYIKRGRATFRAHVAIEAQEHQEDSAERLHSWVGRLEAMWEKAETIADATALVRELRALEQRRAALIGFDAAAKLQISHTGADKSNLSGDATLAAVRKLLENNEYHDAELRAGRPGVISPREGEGA